MKPPRARKIYGYGKAESLFFFDPDAAQRETTGDSLLAITDKPDLESIRNILITYSWNYHAWYFGLFLKILYHVISSKTKQNKEQKPVHLGRKSYNFVNDNMWIEFGKSDSTHCFDYGLVWLWITFTCSTVPIKKWCATQGLLTLRYICGRIEAAWQTRPPGCS